MPETRIIRLALVDDHTLFRRGLISLLEITGLKFSIDFEADNGLELKQKINVEDPPDIILMDVNMPGMNGFESVEWLSKELPKVKVLVLSMIEREESVVRMLKLGVKGYLSKDVDPSELGEAISSVMEKGYYYTDFITGKLVHSLTNTTVPDIEAYSKISEKEKEFLALTCTEFTYGEIAEQMRLSPKTIDGYRIAAPGLPCLL
jgi:two-component system, NarL family, invasion response regulator UvrY